LSIKKQDASAVFVRETPAFAGIPFVFRSDSYGTDSACLLPLRLVGRHNLVCGLCKRLFARICQQILNAPNIGHRSTGEWLLIKLRFCDILDVMHFSLIDKIDTLEPGKRIVATKSLSLAEEYLQDHFPNFPVMPGVLMLEALTQASAWLIRVSGDFAHSIVVLKEARQVKYARFVQPGQTLNIVSELVQEDGNLVTLKAEGSVEGQNNLKAKLILCRYNLSDTDPSQSITDTKILAAMRERLKNLLRL
jgi:3-hydroxyacyl-[acyl-carrier-protein] dehydratase